MRQELVVKAENNVEQKIYVVDIFNVEAFPNKKYIAYTKDNGTSEDVNVYISELKEYEDSFSLLEIIDEAEWLLVQDEFETLINKEDVL